MKIALECGMSLFGRASWRRPVFRRFPKGFAVGPVMVWRTK